MVVVSEALPAEPAIHASSRVMFEQSPAARVPTTWGEVPPIMRAAIKKIHDGDAHAPYKESLVRYLTHGGASSAAVTATRLFRCQSCEAHARHASRPVAARPRYKEFNEAITMDFMIIPDLDRNNHTVLVTTDLAADFTTAVYVRPGARPNAEAAQT